MLPENPKWFFIFPAGKRIFVFPRSSNLGGTFTSWPNIEATQAERQDMAKPKTTDDSLLLQTFLWCTYMHVSFIGCHSIFIYKKIRQVFSKLSDTDAYPSSSRSFLLVVSSAACHCLMPSFAILPCQMAAVINWPIAAPSMQQQSYTCAPACSDMHFSMRH